MSNVKDKLLFKPFKLIKHRSIDPIPDIYNKLVQFIRISTHYLAL